MKRLAYLIILFCFVQISFVYASNIEYVEERNNIVFINNTPVKSCYLVNGYEYIFIEELLKVGFDINISLNENRIDINRNYDKKFDNSVQTKEIFNTNIKNFTVYLDGKEANSFVVETDKESSNIVIQSDELSVYGSFVWNPEMNKIFLNIGGYNSTIINFPQSTEFKNVFSLNSIEDVAHATINFDSGKSAELSTKDIKRILEAYWNFDMIRYTTTDEPNYNYVYFNFYDKNNNKYTIFDYGKILCSNFGENNYIWYMPYVGNARQIFYTITTDLSTKYFDIAVTLEETPNILTTYDNIDFRLPKNEELAKEIKEAASNNILPYELTTQYEKPITREEFCTISTYMLNKIYNKNSNSVYDNINLDNILLSMGITNDDDIYDVKQNISFPDYEYPSDIIKDLYLLGIINERENNDFEPYSNITQVETAQVLYNINQLFDNESNFNTEYLSKDNTEKAISWIIQNNIIPFNGNNSFEAKSNLTREQAIISINRLYKKYINNQ